MTKTPSPSLASLIQKYNLDISIVEVKGLGIGTRIGSEYYQSHLLGLDNIIRKHETCILGDYIEVLTDGKHGGVTFTIEGVIFIRNQNNKEGYIDLSDEKYISVEESKESKRAELEAGDILLTTIGTIGESSVVPPGFPKSNINQNLVRIKLNTLSPYYVSTFFNSIFGRQLLYRFVGGNVQPILNYPNIRNLEIPLPSPTFQSSIAELVQEAHKQRELSKSLYAEAENILLSELRLVDWEPSEQNITEKMSAEVELFGRCDAEFFQPKYDEIVEKIKAYKGGYDTIENLISIVGKQMKIEETKEYQYCELADIDPSLGMVGNFTKILGADLPSRARMKIAKGDVVVSSVAGSCEKVALIQSEDANLVASTGFFVLKPKCFNAETNLVLMKSFFMKIFLERSARGMILSATNQEDFKNIIIPNIPPDIQSLISEKITASHLARETSKKLLEKAKRAVEIFIEEDEESAGKFLNTN